MSSQPIIPHPPAWKKKLLTVGTTGTNGKTSTTAWVSAALQTVARPVPRSTTLGSFLDETLVTDLTRDYNGFIALMKRAVDAGGRFAAVEYTSEALALGFAKAWPADVAIFTNLSHDHLDSHGTPEHYLASKAQLFMHLTPPGTVVLNAADPSSELLREVVPKGARVLAYAVPSRGTACMPTDLFAREVEVSWEGTRVRCDRAGAGEALPEELFTRAIGAVYAENILGALLGTTSAGVPAIDAVRAIAEAPPPAGRFEVIAREPYVVIDYAHTPDALARTLAIARELARPTSARVTVVFGAGGNRDKNKRGPMGAAASAADRIILTSDNPRTEKAGDIAAAIRKGITAGREVKVELDRKKAIAAALDGVGAHDIVIIAGRGHETEQIIGTERLTFSDVDVTKALLNVR